MDNVLKKLEELDETKKELIQRLIELDGVIKYHDLDATGIQYEDENYLPLLIVSQTAPPDVNGDVQYAFHFLEDDAVFTLTENINDYDKKE